MDKRVFDHIDNILRVLVTNLGEWGTVLLIFGIYLISRTINFFNDKAKEHERKETIRQMEKALQRISNENREYRMVIFKEKYGWTDAELEKFIVKADFTDGPSARKELEK